MGVEKRRHPRVERPIDAQWDGGSGRGDVRITSLSLGGCFVDGWGQPSVGERVQVMLRPPNLPALVLSGDVVYCDTSAGFGLRFVPLAPASEEALVAVLQSFGLAEPHGVAADLP